MTPLQKVQSMYAAFRRGDIAFLLNGLAPDVAWSVDGPASVPMFGDRMGRAAVAQFFAAIGELFELHEFTPKQFFAHGETVIVLGYERGTVKATGNAFDGHWAHFFTFRDGQVSAFRECMNSGGVLEASEMETKMTLAA